MTKKERILAHLKSGYSITPLEALKSYGSFRLGAVIFELKREGYDIKTTMVSNGNSHFASYKLETIKDKTGQLTLVV
jgi:hypothetical protein